MTRMESEELEGEIRGVLAIEEFRRTGSKSPAKGVTIKSRKRLDYDDKTALRWCAEHVPDLVITRLDTKRFEKVAEELGAPVRVSSEFYAAIDRDLSHLL